jgi:tetratricopeptide (TPR) repeat protein
MDPLHHTLNAAAEHLAKGQFEQAASTLEGMAHLEMGSGPRGRWTALQLLCTRARTSDDDASRELARSLGADMTDIDFVLSLASQLCDLDATAYAEQALRRLCELDPLNHLPYANLAVCLGRAGRFDEAIAAYTKALERDADFAPAYVQRAYCRQMIGELAESAKDYRAYLARDAEDAEAWDALAGVESDMGNVDEALAAHARAVALDPGRPERLLHASATARRHGRADMLGSYVEALRGLAPSGWQTALAEAYQMDMEGDRGGAWAQYRKAVARAETAGDAAGLATAGQALLWVALADEREDAMATHVPRLLEQGGFSEGILAVIRAWKGRESGAARNHEVVVQATRREPERTGADAHAGTAVVTSGTPTGTVIAAGGREAGVHAVEVDDARTPSLYRRTYEVVAERNETAAAFALEFEAWCGGRDAEAVSVTVISGEGEALQGVYAVSPRHDASAPARLPWEERQ